MPSGSRLNESNLEKHKLKKTKKKTSRIIHSETATLENVSDRSSHGNI